MPSLADLTGQVLDDKYRIDEQLGQGGMGAVYLATHLGTQRPVAVKVIRPQFMANTEFVERFKREAEAAGRLRHPNVVNVTDFGFTRVGEEQIAYLAMEYLDGCSLSEVLKEEGHLPIKWVVDIVEQICSAIDEAHQQGIIHRDLKPDNIWLKPNRRGGYTIKVLDFGLAKLGDTATSNFSANPLPTNLPVDTTANSEASTLSVITAIQPPPGGDFREAATQVQPSVIAKDRRTLDLNNNSTVKDNSDHLTAGELTRVGSVLGTPLYMSPEQCRGEMLGPRTDIYSLGVITYQMLAGQTPFQGNMHTLVAQHMQAPPPPLKQLCPNLPKSVAALVMSALAKNPAERPVSAAAFANALRANAEGSGAILRQAIALYSEHFSTFLRISLIGHLPMIFVSVTKMINAAQMKLGILPELFGDIVNVWLGLLTVLTGLFATAVNAGAFVPVVAQLLVTPLRTVLIRPVFSVLRKRLRAFATTTIRFYISYIGRLFLLVIPGLKAYFHYSLYAPVVMMEGLQGRKALQRSKELVGRLRRTVLTVLILDAVLRGNLAGILAKMQVKLIPFLQGRPSEHLSEVLALVFGILINPLFAITFAMLYFKTRQAGGETLKEALGQQFEETALPTTGWQRLMRERVRAGSHPNNRASHQGRLPVNNE
ncbi:MAG: serine/threonine-protein kinase [Acidobacteriota bacterium]